MYCFKKACFWSVGKSGGKRVGEGGRVALTFHWRKHLSSRNIDDVGWWRKDGHATGNGSCSLAGSDVARPWTVHCRRSMGCDRKEDRIAPPLHCTPAACWACSGKWRHLFWIKSYNSDVILTVAFVYKWRHRRKWDFVPVRSRSAGDSCATRSASSARMWRHRSDVRSTILPETDCRRSQQCCESKEKKFN